MDSEHPLLTGLISLFGAGSVLATMLGMLPPTAALVALVWYIIQIKESDTVKKWILERRMRKLARLKASVIMLAAKMRNPTTPSIVDPD